MKDLITNNNENRLIDQIYHEILSIIYDRGISRSEKLSALNISEKIGVSRTPVSFVLYRMELEGLLQNEGKGGWELRPLDLDNLSEIFEVKRLLFPRLIELATARLQPGSTAKLFAFVDEIERSLHMNDLASWQAADRGFTKLLSMSANNSLLSYFLRICDNQLYRVIISYLSLRNSNRDIFKIYKDIAFAISSENSELAVNLAKNYVRDLQRILNGFMEEVVLPLIGTIK